MDKKKTPNATISLVPIALLFFILGLTVFSDTKLLKYTFIVISILLSAASLFRRK